MTTTGVYLIVCNTDNTRRYYGSAVDIQARWRAHRDDLTRGRHVNKKLQNCWNKYGDTSFTWTVVEECSKNNLLIVEQKYLDQNFAEPKQCLNIARYAGAPMRGRTATEETRRKISAAQKGKVIPDEVKRKMRKPKPKGHGAAVSAALTGIRHPPERRAKARIAQKSRGVVGEDMVTGTVVRFDSLMAARRTGGFDPSHITRCIQGEYKQHKGFVWRDEATWESLPQSKRAHEGPEETAARLIENNERRQAAARLKYAKSDAVREQKKKYRDRERLLRQKLLAEGNIEYQQKAKEQKEKNNERRRLRYANDPEYRARVIAKVAEYEKRRKVVRKP
jgi:group I intron endonuclease